jgi:hypothetical protein
VPCKKYSTLWTSILYPVTRKLLKHTDLKIDWIHSVDSFIGFSKFAHRRTFSFLRDLRKRRNREESIVIFEFTANDVNCQSFFDIVQKKMIVVGVYCSWQNAIACSFTRKELLESSLDALDDREPRYRSKSLIIDTHSPISHGENHQRNMDHTWRILTPNKNTRICWRCWHSSSSTVARR